jgi:hypothetical protein
MQKGEDPEVLAAAKRELETKRAAAATKSTKTFYKVTVKARTQPACVLFLPYMRPLDTV